MNKYIKLEDAIYEDCILIDEIENRRSREYRRHMNELIENAKRRRQMNEIIENAKRR